LREVWRSRSLVVLLARQDFIVRFRRTIFGVTWALILPLVQAAVLALVLSRLIGRERLAGAIDVPFPVFVFSGMVVWTFFSSCVSDGSTSIVGGAGMSTKIYFPRLVFPLVVVGANAYTLAIGMLLLLGMSVAFGVPIGLRALLLVPAFALAVVLAASFAALLSAIHVYARDVRFLVGAALLPWFYLTPVFYRLEQAGDAERWLRLNPLAGVVELVRAATVGGASGAATLAGVSMIWAVLLAGTALAVHGRRDRVFADLL
jgi:lipopolysaccharide transport system permease protein